MSSIRVQKNGEPRNLHGTEGGKAMHRAQRWTAVIWMLLGAAALFSNWKTGNNFQEMMFALSVFIVPGVMLYAGSFLGGWSTSPASIPLRPWPGHREPPRM
jgi:hypothetical protein